MATDSGGETASLSVQLEVAFSSGKEDVNNLFTLTIDEKYSVFANDVRLQVEMYNKLRELFDKSGTTKIVISDITSGSVVISFSLYDSAMDVRTQ